VRDQALAAGRAKDEFLAALSHELRTPLSPVLLLASEAAGDPGLPEDVRRDFEMIRRNVSLEARLIDDLLDLTRLSRGLLKLDVQTCDVHQVLRDALEVVREDLGDKQLQLTVRLGAHRAFARGDAARLQQVFWNVLRNAAHFTPPGGRIAVATRTDQAAGQIIITVTDSGAGIDAEDLTRIFDTFAQGRDDTGARRQFGGLGIGLAICRNLMQLHGGMIEAASAGRGRGATFTIRLPWCLELASTHPGSSAPPRTHAPPSGSTPRDNEGKPRTRGRILLVEDHEPTRTTLRRMLERHRFAVLAAGTAAEAREQAARHDFDVVLSDIGLPDGDGNSLLQELRARRPNLPGIALSGYGMERDIAKAHDSGFSAHLTKPVNAGHLEQALRKVLGEVTATG
jgi:CheY-like chemotaxis protein